MRIFFKKIIVFILTLEARIVLWKYKPKVVGVTGSVGKTSTKDAIYTVLATSFYVRKSEKSYNSEIGVPLTILGCENAWNNPLLWLKNIWKGLAVIVLPNHYPKWLVLEVGLDRPGDISRVVSWLSLDIVVFTALAKTPVHVEFFGSPEELYAEKKKLAKGLKKHGVLVINTDDELLRDIRHPHGGRIITYGVNDGDVQSTNITPFFENGKLQGMTFKVAHQGSVIPLKLSGVVGQHHLYPVLAALAVGISQDLNLVKIGEGLKRHVPPSGRMRIVDGIKDTVVIDDTYNSSPIAARAALDTLEALPTTSRKIVVLGDMMELGKHTAEEHREIGIIAGNVADILVTVGTRAHYIATGAQASGLSEENIIECSNADEAGDVVRGVLSSGDYILVKGSQSVRMEKTVKKLLAYPNQAKETLVRQEAEWLAR